MSAKDVLKLTVVIGAQLGGHISVGSCTIWV